MSTRWFLRILLLVVLVALAPIWLPSPTLAQTVGEVFRAVAPSVAVIRAKGRDVGASGQTYFAETGAGVLVSSDGKVMTAAHVVHTMDEILVEFLGGETVSAKVIASEAAADLSLLQLERVPAGVRVAKMADSDTVRVGDQVIVVGAPYGLSYSLSVGWISARWPPNSVYKTMPLAEFFQTDAVINTGNSGGPMFAMNGDVIGIVSHNISKGGGSEGLGFVVTMNTAKQLLLEKKSFWGGMEGQILTEQLADLLNLPAGTLGFLVKTVAKHSPGDDAGLRGGTIPATIGGQSLVLGGDIILSIDGIPLVSPANMNKIREKLATLSAGSPIKATILRAGRVVELTGRVPE
jgi:S1-C subfamily serine protease